MTPDAPAFRNAILSDRQDAEQLWQEFLSEEAALDPRFLPAEDALNRFRADFPVWLRDTTRFTGVAELGDRIVGLVTAHLWGPAPIFKDEIEVFVEYLFVSQDVRRRGIGTELIREVSEWARMNGASRLRLRTLARSSDANAFWECQAADPFSIERLVSLGGSVARAPRAPLGFRGNSP